MAVRAALALCWVMAGGAEAATLEDVRSAGMLHCGVDDASPGFSEKTPDGSWVGFNVDFCRGVAAAVLGDPGKVDFSGLKPEERLEALQSGEIDLLVSRVPVSAATEVQGGVLFTEPTYYSGGVKSISAEAPAVRQGDDQWFTVVRWVRHQLVRDAVAGSAMDADRPEADIGLEPSWRDRVRKAVGSHAAMFSRNFGAGTARNNNAPTGDGGLLWAPQP